jgi:hypothetical protein
MTLSPNTFDGRIGLKLEMAARTGAPVPSAPSRPQCPWRARRSCRWPPGTGQARIGRPLTPAINIGTPAADRCSGDHLCCVFVLPVPVAPATRPCRLTVASGMRVCTAGSAAPSTTRVRSSRAWPSTAADRERLLQLHRTHLRDPPPGQGDRAPTRRTLLLVAGVGGVGSRLGGLARIYHDTGRAAPLA